MAIAGATTNCIVTKCTKWDNTNNESKEVINLNPYVVYMWLSEMVRLNTKQNSFILIMEYDVTEILKVKQ